MSVIDNLETGREEHLTKNDLLDVHINTISDRKFVFDLVESFKPNVIIHAAALQKPRWLV